MNSVIHISCIEFTVGNVKPKCSIVELTIVYVSELSGSESALMASKITSEKHYNSTRKEKEEVLVIVPEMNFWECSSQQLCLVRFIGYSVHAWVSYSIYLSSRQSRGHTTVLRTKFNRFNMTFWCQHQWHHRCEQCNARGTRKNNHTGSHTCVRRISVKFFL